MKRIHIEALFALLVVFVTIINLILFKGSVLSLYLLVIAVIIQSFGALIAAADSQMIKEE